MFVFNYLICLLLSINTLKHDILQKIYKNEEITIIHFNKMKTLNS